LFVSADDARWIVLAEQRKINDAILDTIQTVALGDHVRENQVRVCLAVSAAEDRTPLGIARRNLGHRSKVPGRCNMPPRLGDDRRTRQNAVEMVGEALRGDEPLAPAIRVADEIGITRLVPVAML